MYIRIGKGQCKDKIEFDKVEKGYALSIDESISMKGRSSVCDHGRHLVMSSMWWSIVR